MQGRTLFLESLHFRPSLLEVDLEWPVNQVQIDVINLKFLETRFQGFLGVLDVRENFCGDEEFFARQIDFLQGNSQLFFISVSYQSALTERYRTFSGIEMTISCSNSLFDRIYKRSIDLPRVRFVPPRSLQ